MRIANLQTAGKDASVLLRGEECCTRHIMRCTSIRDDLDGYQDSSDDDVNMADL